MTVTLLPTGILAIRLVLVEALLRRFTGPPLADRMYRTAPELTWLPEEELELELELELVVVKADRYFLYM